jgi:hypothetical protein
MDFKLANNFKWGLNKHLSSNLKEKLNRGGRGVLIELHPSGQSLRNILSNKIASWLGISEPTLNL